MFRQGKTNPRLRPAGVPRGVAPRDTWTSTGRLQIISAGGRRVRPYLAAFLLLGPLIWAGLLLAGRWGSDCGAPWGQPGGGCFRPQAWGS